MFSLTLSEDRRAICDDCLQDHMQQAYCPKSLATVSVSYAHCNLSQCARALRSYQSFGDTLSKSNVCPRRCHMQPRLPERNLRA